MSAWAWLTWDDLVAIVAGELAEQIGPDETDWLLWEHTAWPMAQPSQVYRQVSQVLEQAQPFGCTETEP